MILKHIMRISVFSCAFFVANIAFSVVRESFNKEDFASLEFWSGDGSLIEESPAQNGNVLEAGVPIGTAENETPKVLALEGQVLCSSSTGKQTDFLLNVSGPSDELPPPENLVGVQIAVAAGTELNVEQNTVPLMLYCNYRNGDGEEASGWLQVSSVKVGTWIRVTMDFDYSQNNGRCKVSVDGVPVVSEKGSLKADGTGGNGAWYKLAKASAKIELLTFVGSAKIDDVVIKEAVSENIFADVKKTIEIVPGVTEEVSLNDLNKWGITPDMAATAKVDDSGLTVAQKLECGLKPDDGKKFHLTSMEMCKITEDGVDKTVATIKFPGSNSAIGRYKVTARNAEGVDVSITYRDVVCENGEVSMDVIIPDNAGRIIFINIKADASKQQSAGN